jgi:hypothetical protein
VAFPFRSRTVGVLIEAIDSAYSRAQIITLLLKAEADGWEPATADSKERLLQLVFKEMRRADTDGAGRGARDLAQMVMEKISPPPIGRSHWEARWTALRDALAADGWEFDPDSSRLTPIVPGVSMPESLGGLEAELDERGWSTAELHFRRAANGLGDGEWESANSQLRSFLEDLLPNIAEEATGKRPKNARAAIQALPDALVDPGERELVKGLWALCNERGSHPGESNPVEATFRLMTVTATARLLLSRLPGPEEDGEPL